MLELSLVEVVLPGWPTASTHTSRTHFPRPLRTADSQVPAKDSCAPTTETRVGKLSPLGGQKARSFMMCFNRSRAMMARGMPLLRAFTTCHLRYTARYGSERLFTTFRRSCCGMVLHQYFRAQRIDRTRLPAVQQCTPQRSNTFYDRVPPLPPRLPCTQRERKSAFAPSMLGAPAPTLRSKMPIGSARAAALLRGTPRLSSLRPRSGHRPCPRCKSSAATARVVRGSTTTRRCSKAPQRSPRTRPMLRLLLRPPGG